MKPLMQVRNLSKTFQLAANPGGGKRRLLAVDDVSFDIFPGETLGLVGESGCGKSTTGKLLLRLLDADSGEVLYRDQNLLSGAASRLRPLRKQLQMIFQDPFSSLNPRMTAGAIVAEPLQIHASLSAGELRKETERLFATVGLDLSHLDRYPHEFSGGQRQRIGIARALAVRPELIIADEPVSALDVSIQAQILNLLQDIQRDFGLTYLFIAHDLAVVEHLCSRVAVMYLGRLVEIAPATALYRRPRHPYTEALLDAVPVPIPGARSGRRLLQGEVPSPLDPPGGCPFHPRCTYAIGLCRNQRPALLERGAGHLCACHRAGELDLARPL
jgi:peptide/nickel transport system ATP-binding protein/oligopeptide transport system ATP-binding protein